VNTKRTIKSKAEQKKHQGRFLYAWSGHRGDFRAGKKAWNFVTDVAVPLHLINQ
jgi:hypothetical protein